MLKLKPMKILELNIIKFLDEPEIDMLNCLVKARNEAREYLFDKKKIYIEDAYDFYIKAVKTKKERIWFISINYGSVDNLVGYINLKEMNNGKDFECGIKILKEERGKGIGKKAMRMFLKELKQTKIKSLVAEIMDKNVNSENLFQRIGFKRIKSIWTKKL